jgi:hypothetical protein
MEDVASINATANRALSLSFLTIKRNSCSNQTLSNSQHRYSSVAAVSSLLVVDAIMF